MIKRIYIKEDINPDDIITEEMTKYFYERTKLHIDLTKKYCEKIYNITGEKEILDKSKIHDDIKLIELFNKQECNKYLKINL